MNTSTFSQIELKIIKLIANEMPNKMIAAELNYSQRMIEHLINKITKKLNVATRVGIVVRAFHLKILLLESSTQKDSIE